MKSLAGHSQTVPQKNQLTTIKNYKSMRSIQSFWHSILLMPILAAFAACNGSYQQPTENQSQQALATALPLADGIGSKVTNPGKNIDCIYQDKDNRYWFASNGEGVYCYDGKTLRNITEEKNLGNAAFLKGQQLVDKPGSLARVFAINEDRQGNLWIGTADAGVWKYDGQNLTNYANFGNSAVPGIAGNGNSVTVLYKDKAGELWLVANGDAVYRLNGETFSKVSF